VLHNLLGSGFGKLSRAVERLPNPNRSRGIWQSGGSIRVKIVNYRSFVWELPNLSLFIINKENLSKNENKIH